MSSTVTSSLEIFPSPSGNDPYNPYVGGGTNSVVALALGSVVGVILLGGFIAALLVGRRVWMRRDGVELDSWRASWRRSYQLETEEKEKPEMDEIQMDEEVAYKGLGRLSEDVVPLSFDLLPSPHQSRALSNPSQSGVVSFLILLPSQPSPQQPSTSSAASSELVENETLPEFVLGSDLVALEGSDREKKNLGI